MEELKRIRESIIGMMEELFGECTERDGVMRSLAENLGVTGVDALVDVLMEPGLEEENPYPVVHFLVTLAKDIEDKDAGRIAIALNELNHIICVGEFPSFGTFAYYPNLHQVFLSYRMPVNPGAPEAEISNIRYYFATLYEQLDIFADFIMFLCDTKGRTIDLDDYIEYLLSVENIDDMEERSRMLSEVLEKYEREPDEL